MIEILKAILIGIVEGITEWLPISSTGHMILVNEFVELDVSSSFLSVFLVVIQLGAIMAVIVLYFNRLNPFDNKKSQRERQSTLAIWQKVVVASIPAAIIGVLFDDWVDEHFHSTLIIAIALIIYGFAFLLVERMQGEVRQPRHMRRSRAGENQNEELDNLTMTQALGIGLFQCLAIVPGTSRSGATILGGRILGVSRRSSAEFSFFMAIPVMFGWSLLKVIKELVFGALAVTATEWAVLIVGSLVAFVVSLLTIRFLIGYVQKNSFRVFGYYRIALGIIVIVYFAVTGSLLS